MEFKHWLEVVAGRQIDTNQPLQISQIDPETDWELASEVEQIAQVTGIRVSSNKDISIIAQVGDQVIGGVANALYQDDTEWGDQPVTTYDFDVVVSPQWQGYQMVGLKLIDAAIAHAGSENAQVARAWVVNKRLAPIMQSRYGFEGGPDIFYKWL